MGTVMSEDPYAPLIELEQQVTQRWLEAVAARTPQWPMPDMDWSTDWAEAVNKPLPPGTMQFPREQWLSYPNRRAHALILANRLLDFEDLTDEQWHTLGMLMLYGGKERIA